VQWTRQRHTAWEVSDHVENVGSRDRIVQRAPGGNLDPGGVSSIRWASETD